MEINLCERFPSLTPFDIREKSAYEVFLLVRRLNEYNAGQLKPKINKPKRVPAGDNWF